MSVWIWLPSTVLAERAADDCEADGHECPPGCPGCHCPHGAVAWHAPAFDGFAEMPLPQVEANFCANRTSRQGKPISLVCTVLRK